MFTTSSSDNILTIGGSNNNVNVGTNNSSATVNVGGSSSIVDINCSFAAIRGLRTLISTNTAEFANYISTPNTNIPPAQDNCYYMLPFSTTQNMLFQWGFVVDQATPTVTFKFAFADEPYLFITKYNNGGGNSAVINQSSLTSTSFVCDTSTGSTDKSSFNWLAMGLYTIPG
jgi:hypothetical protein